VRPVRHFRSCFTKATFDFGKIKNILYRGLMKTFCVKKRQNHAEKDRNGLFSAQKAVFTWITF
jgi:hypothetical protein